MPSGYFGRCSVVDHATPWFLPTAPAPWHSEQVAGWPGQFRLTDDLTEVAWIELDRWRGVGGTRVTSVVPGGFAAYVRVFHPAPSRSGYVTWSEVARTTGRSMHPLAQWTRISPRGDAEHPWDAPRHGEPPLEVLVPLVATLRAVTATTDHCFFAIWDGWGQLHSRSFSSLRSSKQSKGTATPVESFVVEREREARLFPRFELEPGTGRRYLLGTGPLDVLIEIADDSFSERPGVPAAMWWPSDRSWFVASEIDFDSTLVGGSTELRDAILHNALLEASEVPPDGILSMKGDTVNPPT